MTSATAATTAPGSLSPQQVATRAADQWMRFDSTENAEHRAARMVGLFTTNPALPDTVPSYDEVPEGQTWRTSETLRYVTPVSYDGTTASYVVGVTYAWAKFATDGTHSSGQVAADLTVTITLVDGYWLTSRIDTTA